MPSKLQTKTSYTVCPIAPSIISSDFPYSVGCIVVYACHKIYWLYNLLLLLPFLQHASFIAAYIGINKYHISTNKQKWKFICTRFALRFSTFANSYIGYFRCLVSWTLQACKALINIQTHTHTIGVEITNMCIYGRHNFHAVIVCYYFLTITYCYYITTLCLLLFFVSS